MAKDVPFTDIFTKLVDNLERVIKAIDGVQNLTTVLSVLIVLCLASLVAYIFWKTRRRAMAWLFFVCLGLFSAFGLLGVIGQWPGAAAATDYYVIGTMNGLEEIDGKTHQPTIKHVIVPTTEPPSELLIYTTNNGPAPRFEWVVRFPRAVPCQTYIHLHIFNGETKLHTLFVPLFAGGAQTGIKSVHVRAELASKQAFVNIDGQKYEVSFDQPPIPARECTTARLEPRPAPAQERRTGWRWSLVGTALAQPPSAEEDKAFRAGLESANPAVRIQSRTELARRGEKALPWIASVIRDRKSGDLLLAGVIGALVDMQVARAKLDADTIERLLDALDDDGAELRQSARTLLRKIADAGIATGVEKRFAAAKGADKAKAERLAIAVLDIGYAYGVKRYFDYDKNEKDLGAYRDSVAAFRAVVAAADAVADADKPRFARGHWGQIVVKHHRYWTLSPSSAEAKALRAELMAHFKALLAVENAKDESGRPVYRYRQHIDTARRCTTSDYTKSCVKGES